MTVYKRDGLWRYDFWLHGRRHLSPHALATRDDAEEAEAQLKRTLRRRAAGLEALDAKDTPTFTDWAGVTWKWQRDRKKIKRPEEARKNLRMILAFWGARPATNPVEGGEYRDLRLGDPIARPELIGEFEAWMTARGVSGARKNHYRSACSMLYRVALLPENRRRSGVRENPFRDVLRDRTVRRTVVLELDELRRWIEDAEIPVMVAVMLGAAAPALRLANVATLTRAQCSADRWLLTVAQHKTDGTGGPLVVPLSPELRRIILKVEQLFPDDPYIVPVPEAPKRGHRKRTRLDGDGYQPSRYWQLLKLIKASIRSAGLPYGRRHPKGVTFHALRHSLGTWLARWGASRQAQQAALNHATSAMSDWYRHLAGIDRAEVMQLGTQLAPIAAIAERRLTELVPPESRRDQQITVPPAGPKSVD